APVSPRRRTPPVHLTLRSARSIRQPSPFCESRRSSFWRHREDAKRREPGSGESNGGLARWGSCDLIHTRRCFQHLFSRHLLEIAPVTIPRMTSRLLSLCVLLAAQPVLSQ